ncbi:MAG: hypothetical protein ACYCW6_07990 [Candidatus Xenobia bacterium]
MGTIRKTPLAAAFSESAGALTRALDRKVDTQFRGGAQRAKLAMWATICGAPSLHRDMKKAERIFCGWDVYARH